MDAKSLQRVFGTKRGAEEDGGKTHKRRRSNEDESVGAKFRKDLFDASVLEGYTKAYADSKPYKHGVIRDLIAPTILRSVRDEIQSSLHFTPKETDIYKIHQSGDLANLDGLDDSSLSRLPSLLELRNALYSSEFRSYLSRLTGAGPLSGRKTDMAINVYTPGCHLLCHDDVIGSRRVSYILYLTDPDRAWKDEWGGALRLYPTTTAKGADGKEMKTPSPDFSVSVPPAFNQLSFFAVQPGESFHDVEEVYAREEGSTDGDRVRTAISGWYHIPQEGEDGYEEGVEQSLADKSSLVQLQGKGDRFDRPRAQKQPYEDLAGSAKGGLKDTVTEDSSVELSEQDLDHLIKFIAPTYLTPDTMDELVGIFTAESCLNLESFLSTKFARRLRHFVESEEKTLLPKTSDETERNTAWHVARPPFKHRYLYQQRSTQPIPSEATKNPVQELIEDLLPSMPFRKWLSLATSMKPTSHDVLARRFRKGQDYSLATALEDADAKLEVTLGITPTTGWVHDHEDETKTSAKDDGDVGGYEVYLAGDDNDAPESKHDPAVYRGGGKPGEDQDDDDGELFSAPAAWNSLSVVLRDRGVLRFVKYVSRQARGDRWDCIGEYDVADDDEDDEEEEEEEEEENDEEGDGDEDDEDGDGESNKDNSEDE